MGDGDGLPPKGDALARALKWLSEQRQVDPKASRSTLISEAGQRFDLSPVEDTIRRLGDLARQMEAAAKLGAPVVELHTGPYSHAVTDAEVVAELERLTRATEHGAALGLEVHAGHGLTFDNVGPVAAMPQLHELNIGHFLIGEAVFTGLGPAIARMRAMMDAARA